ncbi:hypothetical protein BBJ28_00014143 [Nothophytophthora sp. Chile5]|nr:hypothetical protein BBJ28_00014143 [Nothophytophthora sp. Chile5]
MLSFKLLGAIATVISTLAAREVVTQNFCIHGINYNPRMGPDWAPVEQKCKSAEAIQTDMEILTQVTDTVRLYGLGDCDQGMAVAPAAVNAGLLVSLGLWVSGDAAVFEAEFAKFQELLQQNAALFTSESIVDVHVGSEAIYRKEVTAQENIDCLRRVKELLAANGLASIPVTIAEIGDVYLAHPELTDAVDFVQANGFPFWERIPVETAVPYFETRMAPLYQQAAARGKKVVVGETGWASAGSDPKASIASPANAARYFQDFYNMAQQQGLEFFYFEAFDEEWKITSSNATVEGHFGLFHADGTLKREIADLSLGSRRNGVKAPARLAVTTTTTTTDENDDGSNTTT